MAVRDIIEYPDSVLTEPTEEVDPTSKETHALVQDLIDTMNTANGIGLAAPQIGVSKRVCVYKYGDNLNVLVNPEIQKASGEIEAGTEGCLSFPGVGGEVDRHSDLLVSYSNTKGYRFTEGAEGMEARIIQHEVDHLDGVLFIDRMSLLRRKLVLKRYRKVQKRGS